jgi:hypothetical protein
MHNGMAAAFAVWAAAIASGVVVVHQVEHPMRGTPADRMTERIGSTSLMPETAPTTAEQAAPAGATPVPAAEAEDGTENVMVMPMDTIVGHVPPIGGARPRDLVIGAGTVTHY